MKIVVIAGGLSPERNVSLSSGSLIANALMENGHQVCLMDLYLGTETFSLEELFFDKKSGKRFEYVVPEQEPDLEGLRKSTPNAGAMIGKNVLESFRYADLAFLALHGDIGENGKLQAVLDTFGIKYTGTGYIGSLLAMDKDLSKQLMVQHRVSTPAWQLVDTESGEVAAPNGIDFPCVVKPCSCGSSVGVSIVKNLEEYEQAISFAGKYEPFVLVEEMIVGREFSIGILDGVALPVIEIIPVEGFYDYKNKYQPGFAKEVCPAELSGDTAEKMQAAALKVHKLLRLGSYARIDFLLDSENQFYCLEANTLPGMTPTSLLPQEALAVGISYNELCNRIASLAL